MMWAQRIQRDSTNMASVAVKPMFGFGKAPNTAGGHPFGSIGGSQEGGIFSGVPNRFRSPEQAGRTTNQFRQRKQNMKAGGALEHSTNFGLTSGSRQSDF